MLVDGRADAQVPQAPVGCERDRGRAGPKGLGEAVTSQTWQGRWNSPSSPSTSTSWSRKSLTREMLCSRKGCRGAIHSSLPWPSCWPRFPMLCTAWSKGAGGPRAKVAAGAESSLDPEQSPRVLAPTSVFKEEVSQQHLLWAVSVPPCGQTCTPRALIILFPPEPTPGVA